MCPVVLPVFETCPSNKNQRVGKYAQMRPFDVANGEGIRVSLFVTGCTHACPGCFNADYQSFKVGKTWQTTDFQLLMQYLDNPCIAGLTLLGGEPMQNLWLTQIVTAVRNRSDFLNGDKNIWIYSGYTYEQIINHTGRKAILEQCDVLVDGLFMKRILDLRLKFRGSSNQRIIDVQASLSQNQPILYEVA